MTAAALYAPSAERLQHDRIALTAKALLDDAGLICQPYRVESMLERMERQGDIGTRELDAGELFQRFYRVAHLDPLKCSDPMQEVRAQGAHNGNGIEYARDRIDAAMQALGGHGSPCGSCAWYVLGDELTIAEWARREGWGNRPISPHVAKGTLLGALGVLAAHFGL
jgi:hypothetical protein